MYWQEYCMFYMELDDKHIVLEDGGNSFRKPLTVIQSCAPTQHMHYVYYGSWIQIVCQLMPEFLP
jgi:hypothetical protein